MLLDPVSQGLRMRGNPELGVLRCANDQMRQGIQNVWMQASLWFVECQERRWTRAKQCRAKTQEPHLSVREFLRLQGTEQPRNFHLYAEEGIHSFDNQSRAAKGLRDGLAKGSSIADFKNCLESSGKVRAVMSKNRCIDTNLRLPHGGLQICTEMMIKTPAQDLLAYCGYFRIEMRINDLRQDGLVFRNLEGICDHIAFRVAQPRRRLVPFQHRNATFRFSGPDIPDIFFLYARVECEHGSQCMLVLGREPNLQLVGELLRVKAKHDSFWRFLTLIANALASGPEYAWRAALLGNRSRQLPLCRARHQDKGVVKI